MTKNLFFFYRHSIYHYPLFSFLQLVLPVSCFKTNFLNLKVVNASDLLWFFCNNLICINRAILQPEEIVFTTSKCQQYQLRCSHSACSSQILHLSECWLPQFCQFYFLWCSLWTILDFQSWKEGEKWLLNMDTLIKNILYSISTKALLWRSCRSSTAL